MSIGFFWKFWLECYFFPPCCMSSILRCFAFTRGVERMIIVWSRHFSSRVLLPCTLSDWLETCKLESDGRTPQECYYICAIFDSLGIISIITWSRHCNTHAVFENLLELIGQNLPKNVLQHYPTRTVMIDCDRSNEQMIKLMAEVVFLFHYVASRGKGRGGK